MAKEPKYENEFIKYVFADEERKELATEMAQKIVTLQQTEDDLKAIKSDYKSRIDVNQAGINLSATRLTSGYEMRSTKCEVRPDYAKKVWEYIRVDTGEIAKTKDMTADDLQMEFEE